MLTRRLLSKQCLAHELLTGKTIDLFRFEVSNFVLSFRIDVKKDVASSRRNALWPAPKGLLEGMQISQAMLLIPFRAQTISSTRRSHYLCIPAQIARLFCSHPNLRI